MPRLEVQRLSKTFDGVVALRGVEFAVEERQMVGLVGPNGSGKTTLFNVLSGFTRPTSGEAWFGSARLTRLVPWEVSRLGIGRTFQIARPFAGSTVLDNVLVGVTFRSRERHRRGEDRRREAERLLATVGLADKAGARAAALSLGERKRLELALALSTRPSLLLLDELASGLSPKGQAEVIGFFGRLKAEGLTIFAIEHAFRIFAQMADRLLVLDRGALVADGRPGEILGAPRVVNAYLGEDDEP